MKAKKNPQVDLNRNRGLFFVMGLTLVLFLTWRALEYKTYPKEHALTELIVVDDDIKEDVPVTESLPKIMPPPPPSAPDVIEVVEDTKEIEETVIESTEASQEAVIEDVVIEVDDVAVGEEEEEIIVPFAVIEKVPVFPGCEGGTEPERKACFQDKIQEHILKNFNYPEIAREMGIQGKVFVLFYIDSKGYVTDIKTRGPDRLLDEEAERIIASLPKMIPGNQRGKAVKVPYSIPISFKIL
jgi:protein TonB